MKIIYMDSGFYLDDPNNRWGNPSYQLEPGDPGYVPYFPSVNPNKRTKKHMKRNKYYPIRVGDQIIWLRTYSNELPGLATVVGFSTVQVTALVADCLWLVYLLESWLPAVRSWAQGCTDIVAAAQTGAGTEVVALPVFVAPTLPQGVTPQLPGSLDRIFASVQAIKEGGKFTDNIGTTLKIVGAVASGPDLSTLQPPLTATVSGNHVDLKSGWGGHAANLDNIETQKDWGDGKGFVTLTITNSLTFSDTSPVPATLTAWAYRAIYRVGNQQVGRYSNPVSVGVGGG